MKVLSNALKYSPIIIHLTCTFIIFFFLVTMPNKKRAIIDFLISSELFSLRVTKCGWHGKVSITGYLCRTYKDAKV